MRSIVKAISVIVGIFWIMITLSGEVEYRGFDSPLINLGLGAALIFAPGGVLVLLLGYFLLIAVYVVTGAIGGVLGYKVMGQFGMIIGFVGGVFVGNWLVFATGLDEGVAKLKWWVDGEK